MVRLRHRGNHRQGPMRPLSRKKHQLEQPWYSAEGVQGCNTPSNSLGHSLAPQRTFCESLLPLRLILVDLSHSLTNSVPSVLCTSPSDTPSHGRNIASCWFSIGSYFSQFPVGWRVIWPLYYPHLQRPSASHFSKLLAPILSLSSMRSS